MKLRRQELRVFARAQPGLFKQTMVHQERADFGMSEVSRDCPLFRHCASHSIEAHVACIDARHLCAVIPCARFRADCVPQLQLLHCSNP